MNALEQLIEYLPLLLPLLIAQFALFGYAYYHILTHTTYKMGNRITWLLVSLINFIGPILYFVFGKEDN